MVSAASFTIATLQDPSRRMKKYDSYTQWNIILPLCVCVILGFRLRTYTSSHSPVLFCEGFFFKIGSHKLFAGAGFEPRSSWVAGITGVNHRHPAYSVFKKRNFVIWNNPNGVVKHYANGNKPGTEKPIPCSHWQVEYKTTKFKEIKSKRRVLTRGWAEWGNDDQRVQSSHYARETGSFAFRYII
jgi:hypothetical protein